jgi:hypothetical protein
VLSKSRWAEVVPVQRVISQLFDWYVGSPILVICGGPSVTADLPKLSADFAPALVLSANEHGTKQDRFKVDYIVNCDKTHCIRHVPMEGWLRQFGAPIINRWSWADVRLEDWNFNGNSGTTAVAVAAALGGSPIVVLGIDLYATGRNYFYDTATDLSPQKKRLAARPIISQPERRLGRLWDFTKGAHIRPLSGVLTTRWPKYTPGEQLGPPPVIPYTRDAQARAPAAYRALKGFPFGNMDIVARDSVIMLTKREADLHIRTGHVAKVMPDA